MAIMNQIIADATIENSRSKVGHLYNMLMTYATNPPLLFLVVAYFWNVIKDLWCGKIQVKMTKEKDKTIYALLLLGG